uniref:Uncharacterized protein n=1 Tax=Rhizophora mucronata TaxID=61149 RepID=A0A2P2QAV5_RHIMU
MQTFLDPCK